MIDLYKDILRAVEDLATCPYTTEAFSELLGKVQAAVRISPKPEITLLNPYTPDRSPKLGGLRQP